ncbi:MAG TPA: hypothetical protein VFQ54_05780, partial [Thermomicrobiales bacterium]|nr:hypothetical protein [Thermomicrobiales bacterium]
MSRMMSRIYRWPRGLAFATVALVLLAGTPSVSAQDHDMTMGTPSATATPAGGWSCGTAGTPAAMNHDEMGCMNSMTMIYEFDQLYIDMMLPHHGSIIALAE